MLLLIAGLPRSGKSSLADAVETLSGDFTHVPLDKYLLEIPVGIAFLEWVSSPRCIDWALLEEHLQRLAAGEDCYTPAPDWSHRGRRRSAGGSEPGGRLMHPAKRGYLLPGTYAFHYPFPHERLYRVFIATPHAVIAERLAGHPVAAAEVEAILNERLSSNWRELEVGVQQADLVLSGVESRAAQVQALESALSALKA